MDFIKKIISIEGARTRTQGLMPYYTLGGKYEQHGNGCISIGTLGLETAEGENGNWGQFVANPCFLAEKDKTYEAMLRKYYEILNMAREGIKLRRVNTKEGEIIFTEDVGAFYLEGQCFSGGTEPETLYVYSAYPASDFYSTEIESIREETKNIYRYTGSEEVNFPEFIVLIKEYEKFQKLAEYLDETDYDPDLCGITIGENEHSKWAEYCQVVDFYIGKVNIPASIYNKHIKVPKSMPCADVEPYIEWLENYQTLSADCCNARLYEDMGGDEFLDYLKDNLSGECSSRKGSIESLDYAVPYLEMPILLTQNYTDVGVLTNIDGVLYDENLRGPVYDGDEGSRPHGKMIADAEQEQDGLTEYDIKSFTESGAGITIDQIIMETGVHSPTSGTIEVESLLQTLRNKKKFTDDKDNVLPGDFEYFSGGTDGAMFRCIKQEKDNFYRLSAVTEETTFVSGDVEYKEWIIKYADIPTEMTKESLQEEIEERISEHPEIYVDDSYEKHFYTETQVPSDNFVVSAKSTDPPPYDQINDYLVELTNRLTDTDRKYYLKNPISVAKAKWRMESIPYLVTDFINGDGEESDFLHYKKEQIGTIEGKHYRTITTCEAGIRIAETQEEESGGTQPFMEHYYFKVKYDNSIEKPMKIPYKVGNATNVYLFSPGTTENDPDIYRGDFISALTVDDKTFKVDYVVGGYFKVGKDGNFIEQVYSESGDVYHEEYDLDRSHLDYVALDGVDKVPVWSNYIDFKGAAKEFYSTRYGLTRTGNTATITKFNSGEIWNNETSAWSTYDAYLAKEEYLLNFSLPPKVDVNVTIDRGGVSAFEKHYKLAECNTMQDLQNYNNGEFFPE